MSAPERPPSFLASIWLEISGELTKSVGISWDRITGAHGGGNFHHHSCRRCGPDTLQPGLLGHLLSPTPRNDAICTAQLRVAGRPNALDADASSQEQGGGRQSHEGHQQGVLNQILTPFVRNFVISLLIVLIGYLSPGKTRRVPLVPHRSRDTATASASPRRWHESWFES